MSDELGTVVECRSLNQATVAASEVLRDKSSFAGSFSCHAQALFEQALWLKVQLTA